MKIVTSHDKPPIPSRDADWSAIDQDTYDGAEDSGNRQQVGRGPTELAAINDLVEQLLDERDEETLRMETRAIVAERGISDSTTRIAALTSALSFAEGAIEDAIYTETGIDGDTGQRVLHIIREAMASGTFDQTSPPVEEPPTRRELVHYAEQLKRNVKTAVDDVVATFQDLQVEAGQDDDQATVAAIQEAAARAMRTAVLAALSKNTQVANTGHSTESAPKTVESLASQTCVNGVGNESLRDIDFDKTNVHATPTKRGPLTLPEIANCPTPEGCRLNGCQKAAGCIVAKSLPSQGTQP